MTTPENIPANIDYEECVLGAILLDRTAMDRVADILTKDCFYGSTHQNIFEAFQALHSAEKPIDLTSVSTWFKENNRSTGKKSPGSVLIDLLDRVVSSGDVEYYAHQVATYAKRRQLEEICHATVSRCRDTAQEWSSVIETAQQAVFGLSDAGGTEDPIPGSELMRRQFESLSAIVDGDAQPKGLLSCFYDLDSMTNGFKPGELVIVAGRPAMGKTAFSLAIAGNAAKGDHPVLFFSLEMSADQVSDRLVSMESAIETQRIANGPVSPEEFERLGECMTRIGQYPLKVDQNEVISVPTIAARCRRMKAEYGRLGVVVVDYLHLMLETDDEVRELGKLTRQFKRLARELDCPIVILSQLNRGVESRNNKRPSMADLRQSGAIEQDADLILMLYRDEYYNPETEDKGIAEIIVAKHRNGPTGTVKLLFEPCTCRFLNIRRHSAA